MERPKYVVKTYDYLKSKLGIKSSDSILIKIAKVLVILVLIYCFYFVYPVTLAILFSSFIIVNPKTNIIIKVILVLVALYLGLFLNLFIWARTFGPIGLSDVQGSAITELRV